MPMKLNEFRVQNFKALQNVWFSAPHHITAIMEEHGVDKGDLIDVLAFVHDCFQFGIKYACDKQGGFLSILNGRKNVPIVFHAFYHNTRPGYREANFYGLEIDSDSLGNIYIRSEYIIQSAMRKREDWFSNRKRDWKQKLMKHLECTELVWVPYLFREKEKGIVWSKEKEYPIGRVDWRAFNLGAYDLNQLKKDLGPEADHFTLEDPTRLSIAELGSIESYPHVCGMRQIIGSLNFGPTIPDPNNTNVPSVFCIKVPDSSYTVSRKLAKSLSEYADKPKGGAPVLVVTRNPNFINALDIHDVMIASKNSDGHTDFIAAVDDPRAGTIHPNQLSSDHWYSDLVNYNS
jgi:hypothetical protein